MEVQLGGRRVHLRVESNKPRKLKYNLIAAREQGHHTLVTFGGAYSNHLRATALAGRLHGFQTVGIVRGEERLPLNPVLRFATEQGMTLTYVDRETYRGKLIPAGLPPHYLIPEGGSNELAVRGCAELGEELGSAFDVVCVPAGTGGTLAGLAAGLRHGRAIGFAVLKDAGWLRDAVATLQQRTYGEVRGNWSIETRFHFGGYAKTPPALLTFVDKFEAQHGLRLDPIYTGKMMSGLETLLHHGTFPQHERICAVITG
ncbi:1-aminocyclopropane-1-carboxylate deaminase [Rhizocola hellebori]|uniref:1-aminocyclopropane-1-carboxylate deaminase n=1 Tax=Rhizocola hellebori TaxID=1392758 RepID=A0A8J3VHL7_9ACTN|nr:pyridoxal-phosphate dependent enzyme [Rhizocola hellebori]GIH06402.1 1-aminocyclopropane-1-carboxylate deaminase [Rhizocola hellebori]